MMFMCFSRFLICSTGARIRKRSPGFLNYHNQRPLRKQRPCHHRSFFTAPTFKYVPVISHITPYHSSISHICAYVLSDALMTYIVFVCVYIVADDRCVLLFPQMSDVEAGGATVFPDFGASIWPRKVRAALFVGQSKQASYRYQPCFVIVPPGTSYSSNIV